MERNPRWAAFRRIEGRLKAGKSLHKNKARNVQEWIAMGEIQNAGRRKKSKISEVVRNHLPFMVAFGLILAAIVITPIAFAQEGDDVVVTGQTNPLPAPVTPPIKTLSIPLERYWPAQRQVEVQQLLAQTEYEIAASQIAISENGEPPAIPPTPSTEIPDEDRLIPASGEDASSETASPNDEDAQEKTKSDEEKSDEKESDEEKPEDKKSDETKSDEKQSDDKKDSETEKKNSTTKKKSQTKKEKPVEVMAVVKLKNDKREKLDPPTESQIAKVVRFEATAYTHTGEKTAKGNWPKIGTIAVNPKQIPYGTRLYVEGYGYGIADDTGGFRHSGKKQIDLFMDTESECRKWGRKRDVKVYILKE